MILEFQVTLYPSLLAAPTLIGTSGYNLVMSMSQSNSSQGNLLLIGSVTPFLVALLVIKLFKAYIQTKNFIPFGVYRILIVIAFYALVISNQIMPRRSLSDCAQAIS